MRLNQESDFPVMSKFNNLKSRWNIKNNYQFFVIFFIFAITGSTAAFVAKPILSSVGITKESIALWIYYPLYIILIYPLYKVLLLFYGALFGQFDFFWKLAKKMLERLKLGFIARYIDAKLKKQH